MAELVAPGVWWLHGTRGSNVYLVEADDGQLALVDTGFGSNVGAILGEVDAAAAGRPIGTILLTHHHLDHIGSAQAVRERTGARVVAGKADCVRRHDEGWEIDAHLGRSHLVRVVVLRLLRHHTRPVPVDWPLVGEAEVLPGLRAIPAPGHTPGSYCFVSRRANAILVGDLVISHGGRLSRPLVRSHSDALQYEETLLTLSSTDVQAGCPGHGEPVRSGFGDALRTLSTAPPRRRSVRTSLQRIIKLHSFALATYRRRSPPR